MLGALSLPVLFTSCGDDDDDEKEEMSANVDDESNTDTDDESSGSSESTPTVNVNDAGDPLADVGFILCETGDTLLVSSIGRDGSSYMSYGYGSNGLPTSAAGYTISYSPLRIIKSPTYITPTYNVCGYIKKLSYSTTVDSSIDYVRSEVINCTYDDDGHLTRISSSCTDSYYVDKLANMSVAQVYSYTSNFTWSDGDLTSVSIKEGQTNETYENGVKVSSYSYDDYTFKREITYSGDENVYLQPTMAILSCAMEFSCWNSGLLYQLGCAGLFGVGPAHLPDSCEGDINVFFSYDLNDDGTISKENINGNITYAHSYTYSYITFTSGN